MSDDEDKLQAEPTELEAAYQNMQAARIAADEAEAAFKEAEAHYNDLVTQAGIVDQDHPTVAIQHYFASVDAQAAERAAAKSLEASLSEALKDAPSPLDAARALQGKVKKRPQAAAKA